MIPSQIYYLDLATSYILCESENIYDNYREFLPKNNKVEDLDVEIKNSIISDAKKENISLRRFKKTILDRVTKCTGIINGFYPTTLLDVGSGRGNFLHYYLYNNISNPQISISETSEWQNKSFYHSFYHTDFKNNVEVLGVDLNTVKSFNKTYDVVSILEVLEHIENWEEALLSCLSYANKAVVISVPSKEDNNPEHLRVINEQMIEDVIGNKIVKQSGVLNHNIFLIKK